MDLLDPEVLFRVVDVIGVFANGLIGGAVARSKGFDPIGFLVLAIVSGMGGGLLRDLMLGVSFPVMITDPWYLSSAVAAAALAFISNLDGTFKKFLSVADMLALGCWSATGAAKAMAAGVGIMPAILLGVITATVGGMTRDIMVNQVPSVFGGGTLYASLAVVSSLQMALLYEQGLYQLGMGISIVMCLVLGLTAQQRNWMLPSAATLTLGAMVRVPGWRRRRTAVGKGAHKYEGPAEQDPGDHRED